MELQSTYRRTVYSGFEPCLAYDVLYGGHVEHRLMHAQAGTLEHHQLVLDELHLDVGQYDFPVIAQGRMPQDAFCVSFAVAGNDVTRYNTVLAGADEVQLYGPGAEFLYHAAGASSWVNLAVTEACFQRWAVACVGRPMILPATLSTSIHLDPARRAALANAICAAVAAVNWRSGEGEIDAHLARDVYRSLLFVCTDILSKAGAQIRSGRSAAQERNFRRILACERIAMIECESDADAEFAISDAAEQIGCTRRALERTFRRSVDMTPTGWILNKRLNCTLRDFLAPSPSCSVSGTALNWGFRHLSRFSEHYRATFGELPSQTLSRSRSRLRQSARSA
ncbi:AraC family transcriptional regulator [Pararobbsia silviterrae]|nr:helix-turn-helix domain-containing protein [Pararobbsia silviterrae]